MEAEKEKRKKKNILFGAVDIGFRIEHYSLYIKKYYSKYLSVESLVIFKLPSTIYHTEYTYEYHLFNKPTLFRWFITAINFIRFLFRFDTFHFISGETLLTRKLRKFEFYIYKLFNKKIIMHFVGADIRSIEYTKWKDKNIEKYLSEGLDNQPIINEPYQKKLIDDSNQFAKHILVSTPDMLDIIPRAIYFPVVIDLDKFLRELNEIEIEPKNKNEIVILHSPSNTSLKGTLRIHDILIQLRKESDVKIKLLLPANDKPDFNSPYSTSRYNLFKLYKEADIVIDQMIIGWYGLQSIEAMAAEKLTVCYIDDKFKNYLFDDCPIIAADILNLKEILKEQIEKIQQNKISTSGQLDWVRKYHTIEKYNSLMEKIWVED